MKTYKLIKEYPNSPKLGATFLIAEDSVSIDMYSKFTEFYKEIIVPDIVTEDGYTCRFGNRYTIYGVEAHNNCFPIIKVELFTEESFNDASAYNNRKWFINKANAEHYLIQNKPVLSLKDIASVYVTADLYDPKDSNRFKASSQPKKLYDLVKSKLNLK